MQFKNKYLDFAYKKYIKPFQIKKEDFIREKSSNLFLSGISGRTGTTWLMNLIEDLTEKQNYLSVGETGFFVLSQFRNAPYEFYQPTPRNKRNKEAYLKYFYHFISKWAYNRRKMYGVGLKGLSLIVPPRAIKISFNELKKELNEKRTLNEIYESFGNFYSSLLNFHSLVQKDTLKWISKEPGYARHADDLYKLIPSSKNLILVRDGRDVALSMKKRKWEEGDLKKCILRWKTFTEMTLKATSVIPKENYLFIKYENLVDNFSEEMMKILKFYEIKKDSEIEEKLNDPNYNLKPIAKNYEKWKKEYNEEEKKFFEENCSEIMESLGYS